MLGPGIADLTVGLVTDQKDLVPKGRAFGAQNIAQPLHTGAGIRHAAGVVGRVDQHRSHRFVQHLLQLVKIRLKGFSVGRHNLQHGIQPRHIGAVLGKIGRKGKHLLPRSYHRAQGVCQRTGSAGGGKNMLCFIGKAKTPRTAFGHSPAKIRVSLIGAIAVQRHGFFFGQQLLHGRRKRRRTGHAGIAQTVIEHIFIADLSAALFAVHENLADHGFL